MNQKTRMLATMLAFLLLAGGTAAWAYWGVFEAQEAEEAREDAERRLLTLEAEEVRRLEVTAKDVTTVIEKKGDRWRITAPVEAAADEAAVDGLLDRLVSARRQRKVEGTDPAAFGLAPPLVVVAAIDEAGTRAEVALGKTNAFDGSIFVRDDRGAIGTANASLRGALERTTFDLRDKRLVVVGQDTVSAIVLSNGVELVREAEGWFVGEPVRERADDPTADGIVRALQDLRATAFAAEKVEDLAAWGLDAPVWQVELRRKEGEPVRIAFGQRDGKTWARAGEGPVAEVRADVLDSVRKELDQLRDRSLVSFTSTDATRVRVEGEGETIVLQKGDDGWRLAEPKEAKAKGWRVTSLLSTFSRLRADRLAPVDAKAADYGLAEPRRTVTAFDAAGKELARLEVGRKDATETWVRAAGATRFGAVDNTRLSHLLPTVADLEDATAADVASAAGETND